MNKIINYLRTIFGSSKVEMVEINESEIVLDPVWEEMVEIEDDTILKPKWDVNKIDSASITKEIQPLLLISELEPTNVEIIEEPKIIESIAPNVNVVTEVTKVTKKHSNKRKHKSVKG
jgi:hypothetical protein